MTRLSSAEQDGRDPPQHVVATNQALMGSGPSSPRCPVLGLRRWPDGVGVLVMIVHLWVTLQRHGSGASHLAHSCRPGVTSQHLPWDSLISRVGSPSSFTSPTFLAACLVLKEHVVCSVAS